MLMFCIFSCSSQHDALLRRHKFWWLVFGWLLLSSTLNLYLTRNSRARYRRIRLLNGLLLLPPFICFELNVILVDIYEGVLIVHLERLLVITLIEVGANTGFDSSFGLIRSGVLDNAAGVAAGLGTWVVGFHISRPGLLAEQPRLRRLLLTFTQLLLIVNIIRAGRIRVLEIRAIPMLIGWILVQIFDLYSRTEAIYATRIYLRGHL